MAQHECEVIFIICAIKKQARKDQTTHIMAITMAQPIFNLIDDGRRQLDGCSSCSHSHKRSREVESAGVAHTTTRKWMVCSSTMAVWMNAAHRTMGGDIGEKMEVGGCNNIHCQQRNGRWRDGSEGCHG
jgi:hypothetical protein